MGVKLSSPSALPAGTVGVPSGAWTVYAPTWTAVTTPPAIGNGQLAGAYLQVGKLVAVRFLLDAGATTTFGVGAWRFALPVASIAADTTGDQVGDAWAYDSSAGFHWIGVGVLDRISGTVVTIANIAGGIEFAAATPFAWAVGDRLAFSAVYEAA